MSSTSTTIPLVNQLARQMGGSVILAIAYEVQGLCASGKRVANFTIGDFDPTTFHIPQELQTSIFEQYQHNKTNYPPAMGVPELRKAITQYYQHELGLDFKVEQIAVGSGVRPLLYAAFMTIVEPGEVVIYPQPSWNSKSYALLCHATPAPIETKAENNFLITAGEIAPYLSDAVIVALCSPSNPTGTMYDRETLKAICDMIYEENLRRKVQGRKPCFLIYDQVYSKYNYSKPHFHPCALIPDLIDYTIYIDGMSKSFAATGIRVGWCAGPAAVVPYISNLIGYIGAWAPKPEQLACADYLTQFDAQHAYLEPMREVMNRRLHTIYDRIQAMKAAGLPIDCLQPEGGMFLSIQLPVFQHKDPDGNAFANAEAVRKYILHSGGCAFIPFYAFDAPQSTEWFRASVSSLSDDDLAFGLNQLQNALEALQAPR
jgi:aspartate aminotransferase